MSYKSPVLSVIQEIYPGYHPLVAIAQIAHSMDRDVDARLRFDCHKTIAKYVEPELKSLEIKGQIEETRQVRVSLFSDDDIEDAEFTEPLKLTGELIDRGISDY